MLQTSAKTLEDRVLLLEEALNNMPVGVLMFDDVGKIQLCNGRYVSMYGLDPSVAKPGCTLQELIQHRKDVGYLVADVQIWCDRILQQARHAESAHNTTTSDGRTIHIATQPIKAGGWISIHEDVTKQTVAEAHIAHMALHDALTDLPNRVALRERLEQGLRAAARGDKLAVLFLDLDNFKGVNDTLGHPVGDQLLISVADRLRDCVRETDTIARLGGDEFVVIQSPLVHPSEAAALAQRIREAIIAPFDLLDHQVVVDTSIGIAVFPDDGGDPDLLLKNADMALYGAKAGGRGIYRFFEQGMDTRMMERRVLELELRAAFVNGEFEIHYQPLVNLQSDQITCCEALLRWRHPERGMVAPDDFIPLAEEIGLIARLGEWVIRTACAEAARWPSEVTVAVNVSPVQFKNQNLVQVVANALAASGLAGDRLTIEITEAILIEHTETTLAVLHKLRALGVRIAMDDFGTGYSSLSYLQKFPFDKIKIDRSFIEGLSETGETNAIVKAVTSLADSFRMTTTAEGVETEAQRAIIQALGCTEMQGYLFSKARTPYEIGEMLAGQGWTLEPPHAKPLASLTTLPAQTHSAPSVEDEAPAELSRRAELRS